MAIKLTPKQIEQYHRKGYLLIPDVFNIGDLQSTRVLFQNAFKEKLWENAPYSNTSIINDIYSYFPEIVDKLYTPDFFQIVKDILGDELIWIPECSIHKNRFINWHKDTSFQESGGEMSHKNYSYPLLQTAIYFQDNSADGGGLTIIPETHNLPDRYHSFLKMNTINKMYFKVLQLLGLSIYNKEENLKSKIDVPSKLGSLLVFDLRINHRSTFPTHKKIEADKFAIFNTFGKNDSALKGYFDFMKQRTGSYYRYFQEFDLPDIVYNKAEENRIKIWY